MENTLLDLTTEQRNDLQNIIMEQIRQILPSLVENIIPVIIKKAKEITTDKTFSEADKSNIIKENREKWNKILDKRENLFYKYHRTTRLLDLYTECLEQDELYIPRKFRQDNTHISNPAESTVIRKLEYQRFQAECEILRIRRDNFNSDIQKLDQNIKEEISNATTNTDLQTVLVNSYESFCEKDKQQIIGKWNKKIQSLKKAFQEDRKQHNMNTKPRDHHTNVQMNPKIDENTDNDVIIPETQDTTENSTITNALNTSEVIPETQDSNETDPSTTNKSKNWDTINQTSKMKTRSTRKS